MFTIGCHLSTEGGYEAMAHEAESIHANTFQFFTRNPRGGHARAIDPADLAAFQAYAPTVGIEEIMGYASYTMNLAGPDQSKRDFALAEFAEDIARMEETPHNLYALHCGNAESQAADHACSLLADAMNATLQPSQTTRVALVTMSGRGTEIGSTFAQLARVLNGITLRERVGICLDTCNLWNAGYDLVNDLDGVLKEFDATVGLDRVYAVHLTDAKYGKGSHEGRHANIGEGTIGFDALTAVTNHPALASKPFYLEEPHARLAEYMKNIDRFRAAYEMRQ
ncbi:deoxyribonuclease IV [Adlercreutzia murintestinalis]|uniref:deoxyribonuclease IV n=1 Tax=Adlercreutzia murintestinalis TaxID=2941325 RepID=UPI00203E67DD|nr:deoxyribonuclease IV [Adlercreutzia murintestinalis]